MAKSLREQFCKACNSGDLEKVKALYEKVELLRFKDPLWADQIVSDGVDETIENGHLHVIKYIFESHPNGVYPGERLGINTSLSIAASYNKPEIIKYIVQENKEKNFNIDVDDAFQTAYGLAYMDVLRVLIFDYEIQNTSTVLQCLDIDESRIRKEVENMFKLRELNKTLHSELAVSNPETNKKLKV